MIIFSIEAAVLVVKTFAVYAETGKKIQHETPLQLAKAPSEANNQKSLFNSKMSGWIAICLGLRIICPLLGKLFHGNDSKVICVSFCHGKEIKINKNIAPILDI